MTSVRAVAAAVLVAVALAAAAAVLVVLLCRRSVLNGLGALNALTHTLTRLDP